MLLLKPALTEQVGGDNDRDLVERVLPGTEKPFPHMNLAPAQPCVGRIALRGGGPFRRVPQGAQELAAPGVAVQAVHVLPEVFPDQAAVIPGQVVRVRFPLFGRPAPCAAPLSCKRL